MVGGGAPGDCAEQPQQFPDADPEAQWGAVTHRGHPRRVSMKVAAFTHADRGLKSPKGVEVAKATEEAWRV